MTTGTLMCAAIGGGAAHLLPGPLLTLQPISDGSLHQVSLVRYNKDGTKIEEEANPQTRSNIVQK